MSTEIVTQCPGCQTQFKVTQGQLKIANGQVRCGSCLMVFVASDHQVKSSVDHTPASAHVVRASTHSSSKARTTAQPANHNSALAVKSAIAEASATPAHSTVDTPNTTADSAAVLNTQTTANTSAAQSTPTAPQAELTTKENANLPPVLNIRAEPLDLVHTEHDDNPVAVATWLIVGALACLLLAFQYLWFNRAELGKMPELESVYSTMCGVMDCTLSKKSVDQVHVEHLVVRPHPSYADAIVVDLVLENDAAFAQPYPALDLEFRNLQGRVVAQRVFQPYEYLDLSRINPNKMPAQIPVQLNLEMTDPGAQAVSYHMLLGAASSKN